MIPLPFAAYALAVVFPVTTGFVPAGKKQAAARPPVTIVTDQSWEISGRRIRVGEYPLPAERIASATSPLYGGNHKPATAEYSERSKIVPGAVPIWRNPTTDSEGEAYQFRKTVPLGADPIRKVTLEVNCDDVARIYINKRLVSAEKRDGTLKDGYDDYYDFRSVTGFTSARMYTYDVTDYFFTNVTNTIFAEVASLAFDGNHAYLSARIVIEFAPASEPSRQTAAKPQPPARPKADTPAAATPPAPGPTPSVGQPAAPEKTVFEAGRDPEIEKLRVGSILELGHVYFKADDHRLDAASYRTLAALAKFMKRHPGLKIEIGGHTNLRAGDRFAAELSANRARSVMRYLTDNGVAPDRVTYKGYGKSQPRLNALTEEADRVNQRVEVKVLGK